MDSSICSFCNVQFLSRYLLQYVSLVTSLSGLNDKELKYDLK